MQISFNTHFLSSGSLIWFSHLFLPPCRHDSLSLIANGLCQLFHTDIMVWQWCPVQLLHGVPDNPTGPLQFPIIRYSSGAEAPYEVLSLTGEISNLHSCIPTISLALRILKCLHSQAWHQAESFQTDELFELFNRWKPFTEIKAFFLEEPAGSLSFLVRATMTDLP